MNGKDAEVFTSTQAANGSLVVRCQGRLNMITAPELRDLVGESVTAGKTRIVVDLADVDFMDSTGLGALVAALKQTRQAGGDLRIASPGTQVSMVLKLSNIDRIFGFYPDAEAAFDE